jgi:murein peptide amidase A
VIGTSIRGRDITAWRRPVVEPGAVIVVVGGIHGNEPVSPPIVRSLVEVALPEDLELWLVPELNVDGVAVGTRANARGVDLNRNFSWRWDGFDGGPSPLSEPEPRAIAALIETLRPDLVVWVHQPLGYVSAVGETPDAFEQAWSRGSGVRVRPDVTQHGGGESWTAFVAGVASMLVEVDTYEATPDMVAAHQNGFRELLVALG